MNDKNEPKLSIFRIPRQMDVLEIMRKADRFQKFLLVVLNKSKMAAMGTNPMIKN